MQDRHDKAKESFGADALLRSAGLTRAELASAFGVSRQRLSQILTGRGVSYHLADDLQRYINRKPGRLVCRNEHFISTHGKEKPRRR